MLENASTDYDEILIYEKYTKDLVDIIYELVIQLNCKDRKVSTLKHSSSEVKSATQTSASTAVDLKKENPEDTAIISTAMDLSDKMFINVLDNKNETNGKPDDLRHQFNSNDLQSTCKKPEIQDFEANYIENDVIKAEYKRTSQEKEESFYKMYELSVKSEDNGKIISDLLEKNKALQGQIDELEKKNKNMSVIHEENKKEVKHRLKNIEKCNISDMEALVNEIADKHDYIARLRSKIKTLEEKLEQYERKVQFREKIIRELRHKLKNQQQDSMGGKSMSEVNFDCYDDMNKDEMERLQQTINEIESENSCNRLMITKLEDELVLIRKCESRNKQDRNLKTDKLNVLRHKIKSIEGSVLEKSVAGLEKPKLHHNDLMVIEDELKPEFDVLNKLVKIVSTTKTSVEKMAKENAELKNTIDVLQAKLLESQQNNQNLSVDIQQMNNSKLPEIHRKELDIKSCDSASRNLIAQFLSHLLGKEISAETIGDLTGGSSSPEISSGNSSLTNGHSSLSDVINEWKHEIEEKKCEVRSKNAKINDLEERLRIKEEEVCEIQNDLKSVQVERDKSCQMVNQLKNAIQYHNESIQFLKRQNAELKDELDEARSKFANHRDYYDEMKKRNIELEDENNNMQITISSMRTHIEDLKRGNTVSGKNYKSLKNTIWRNGV